MSRQTFLLLTDFECIEEWCQKVRRVFRGVGHVGVFLVGSSLTTKDYRDIDLRLMLTDETWDTAGWSDPVRTRYVNVMFSIWGQRETGLPIDFQVQRMSTANASFAGPRDPMGIRDWERNTPAGGVFDDPDAKVDEPCGCGRKAYRPEGRGTRRAAIRCSGCHFMRGNCRCAATTERPAEPDEERCEWIGANGQCKRAWRVYSGRNLRVCWQHQRYLSAPAVPEPADRG